ncbi:MAG: hypothetical protein P8018_06845 [Acidobacteriota bacterium]|jgi:hypothetical protein
MSKTPIFLACWAAALLCLGCAGAGPKPVQSQLQIRQYQTRNYATGSQKLVMKALLNVLQDDGFIVKNVNLQLGFISGGKEVNIEDKSHAFWRRFWHGKKATWNKFAQVETSLNVSPYGKGETRVRANFQVKTLNNRGVVVNVETVNDPHFYQQFFATVQKSLYLQKQHLG